MTVQTRTDSPAAIVTGAGRGIGRAIALRLVDEGYRVVAVDLDVSSLSGMPDRVLCLEGDVADPIVASAAVAKACAGFGGVHLLVNNAGIGGAKSIAETSDDDFRRFLDVNLVSAFSFSRAALPEMRPGSSVINISSIFGLRGPQRSVSYSATKAALVGLTYQLAADWGSKGIRVNAIAPGVIQTETTQQRISTDRAYQQRMIHTTPSHRVGRPEDIASAVNFLASDQASFINGHVLVVDGGWSTTSYLDEEKIAYSPKAEGEQSP